MHLERSYVSDAWRDAVRIESLGPGAAVAEGRPGGLDLKGRTATPGLIDSHAHIAAGGVDEVFHLQLSDTTSVAEVVERVAAKAATLKPGEWVLGAGWDEGKLAEKRLPTAADFDAVTPNNPVWLTHTTLHYGVANSAALKLAAWEFCRARMKTNRSSHATRMPCRTGEKIS